MYRDVDIFRFLYEELVSSGREQCDEVEGTLGFYIHHSHLSRGGEDVQRYKATKLPGCGRRSRPVSLEVERGAR